MNGPMYNIRTKQFGLWGIGEKLTRPKWLFYYTMHVFKLRRGTDESKFPPEQ